MIQITKLDKMVNHKKFPKLTKMSNTKARKAKTNQCTRTKILMKNSIIFLMSLKHYSNNKTRIRSKKKIKKHLKSKVNDLRAFSLLCR